MSQDATIIPAGLDGTSFRLTVNEALATLGSHYYGPIDPTALSIDVNPGTLWWDTGASPAELKVRNATDTDWVTLLAIDGAAGPTLQAALDAKLDLAGGTMTGDLVLAGDPDAALKAATKQYVDATSRPAPVRWMVMGTATVSVKIAQALVEKAASFVGLEVWSDDQPTGTDLVVTVVRLRAAVADDSRSATVVAATNAISETFGTAMALEPGDRLRLDVTQIGSTQAGGNDLLVTCKLDPP